MRILVATGLYPPEGGGPAKHTLMMEHELPKHGIDVSVLPFRHVRRFPKGIRHLVYVGLLIKESLHVRLIFAQDTVSVGFPAAIASLLTRRPLIVRVPGDHAWEQARQRYGTTDSLETFQTKPQKWPISLLQKLARWTLRRASIVIVPSGFMKQIVAGWGIPEDRIQVAYNGITMPVEVRMPAERPAGTLLVSVGRQVPWKHFDALIRLLTREPDWQLVLVGDGPEHISLQRYSEDSGVARRVHFVGTDHAQAMGWSKSADVFILNSSYEGLSHVLIEVMSLGTPIVATDIPGNRELIEHEVHGLLVPQGNDDALLSAVRSLVHNQNMAKKLAENALERSREFNITHTGAHVARIIQSLCVSSS